MHREVTTHRSPLHSRTSDSLRRILMLFGAALIVSCGGSGQPGALESLPASNGAGQGPVADTGSTEFAGNEDEWAAPTLLSSATDKTNAWSSPATWGGSLPAGTNAVIIPAGKTVVIDRPIQAKNITVNGTLVCDRNAPFLSVSADWIMVMGQGAKLECGTLAQPHDKVLQFMLTGQAGENIHEMGTRFIAAMGGGVISLHGQERTGWLKLDATASAGERVLTLSAAPVGWKAGHKIIVASSSENPRDTEEHVIASIKGNQVTLKDPLTKPHFGEQQTFSNGKRSWTVDTRAPVALLSRNIMIMGPSTAQTDGFGAHTMVMEGSKAYFKNVGFRYVGQKATKGRYPFHWHLVGDGTGQYVKNSVINGSANRCYTVHGTDNTEVTDNVCYNHVGHGYFLEDGVEQGNTITGNLGVLTIKPPSNEAILPTDNVVSPATAGPATFWISNPQNTVRNNHANGSEGSGIWNFFENRNMARYDGQTINPRNLPFVEQADNTVSASEMGLVACEIKGGTQGVGGPGTKAVTRFTAFMTKRSGLWPCGDEQVFDDARLLDSGVGDAGFKAAFVAPQRMLVKNSLFVANSRLANVNGGNKSRHAFGSYDQGSILQDSHFIGYTAQTQSSFVSFAGGAVKDYTSRMQGLTFDPPQVAAFEGDRYSSKSIVDTFSVLNDVDGSLGAGGGMTLMPRSVFTDAMGCSNGKLEANTHGALCPARIVRTRAQDVIAQTGDVVMFMSRDGKDIVRKAFTGSNGDAGNPNYVQFVSVPNQNYHLGAEFSNDPGGKFYLQIYRASPGDVIRYELRNLRPNTRITNTDIAQVSSLDDLEASTGSAWFRSDTTVHFKVVMSSQGKPWDTTRGVNFNSD